MPALRRRCDETVDAVLVIRAICLRERQCLQVGAWPQVRDSTSLANVASSCAHAVPFGATVPLRKVNLVAMRRRRQADEHA